LSSTNRDAFWVASGMADKYGVPKWLVSLAHIKGLFMSSDSGAAAAVESALAEKELATPLLEAAGDECWNRIDTEVRVP
jgi:hypothetical protein